MARKERNSIDYFPHSVTHGKKMFYLRSKYKNDGYTVWFMLLEELGKAEYHYLNLSDDVQIMYLASEFMVSEEVLRDIINTLVKFGEFNKYLWEKESILFNEKFVENISDAYKKRNNECVTYESLLFLLQSKGILKQAKLLPNEGKGSLKGDGNTQSKLKETKVKYSKWKDDSKNEGYKFVINFILGDNITGEPLDEIIGMDNPISEDVFEKLRQVAISNDKKITDVLMNLENKMRTLPKGKKYKSLSLTLNNWLKSKF